MIHETLNLRHLRAFCEVARCGSISGASGAVFLSQPAITQAIAKLEQTLGAALFVRNASGMFPTEPGSLFQARADRALHLIRVGARKAARSDPGAARAGFAQFDQLLTAAQLRALLAVSQTGNFSWAARSIGISQPSLHRVARDLERLSGLSLFRRGARSIETTPAAVILEQHSRLAFAELKQGVAEIGAWLGNDTAQINIGSLPLARSFILPHAINAFSRHRPDARLRVFDGAYTDLLHDLRQGGLDLIIGALRDPVPVADVVQEPLLDDALAIVARKGHPLTGQDRITAGDLAAYPWVVPAAGIPTRDHFDALFAEAGQAIPAQVVETSSLILVRGLLLDSDRLTVISAHQIQHEIDQGLLACVDFPLPHASRPIGTTCRADWRPTATQSLLLGLLRDAGRAVRSLQRDRIASPEHRPLGGKS